MAIFAAAAGDSQKPLRGDYAQAAQMVHMSCGPGFVEAGVAVNGAGGSFSMLYKSGGGGFNVVGLISLALMALQVLV